MRNKSFFNIRALAIIVLAVVSGASFALGFFVGRSTNLVPPLEAVAPQFAVAPLASEAVREPMSAKESVAETSTPSVPYIDEEAVPKPVSEPVKAKTPMTAEAKKAEATGAAKFCIQAGAFHDMKEAEALQMKLKAGGYDAYIGTTADTDNRKVYRVRAGRFGDRKEADMLALKLKKFEGVDAFVTTLE